MEQPVIVKFRWSEEDLLKAHRYHFRHTCRPLFRIGLQGIFAFMLLGGAWAFFKGRPGSSAFAIALMAVGAYWFLLRPFERRWSIRRQYAIRPDKDRELEWEVGPEKLVARSSVGHSVFTWEALVKVVQTPSGIMMYSMAQCFQWLPRRGFQGDAEFERCADMAKLNAKRFYEVS